VVGLIENLLSLPLSYHCLSYGFLRILGKQALVVTNLHRVGQRQRKHLGGIPFGLKPARHGDVGVEPASRKPSAGCGGEDRPSSSSAR
jgi:hypothetical protein